jgi:hypothetical protein
MACYGDSFTFLLLAMTILHSVLGRFIFIISIANMQLTQITSQNFLHIECSSYSMLQINTFLLHKLYTAWFQSLFSDTNQLTLKEEQVTVKQRPVSITIGEYPSGVERRIPTRFDFLSTNVTDARKPVSSVDSSNITCQLQSELAQTLSRSNLRKQTDSQVNIMVWKHTSCL